MTVGGTNCTRKRIINRLDATKALRHKVIFMLKYFSPIVTVALAFSLLSCSSSTKEIERVPVKCTMLAEGLYTKFPGTLLVDDKYIIMQDPFTDDGLIKLYDRNNGEMITQIGHAGKGPEEFVTSNLHNVFNGQLFASDMGGAKKAIAILDSIPQKRQPFKFSRWGEDGMNTAQMIAPGEYLIHDFSGKQPFRIINEVGENIQEPFGKWLIEGAYDDQQGTLRYLPGKNIFVYAMFDNPYIAMYQRSGKGFELTWENQFGGLNYTLGNNRIKWGDDQEIGINDVAFLKDYIACLRREALVKDHAGRDISKLPRTLYLFDYKGQLVKICELEHPTLRIAADGKSNTLYAINVPDEFCIVKYEL